MHRCLFWGWLTVGLSTYGCAHLRAWIGLGFQQPKVEITGIRFKKLTKQHLHLIVKFAITNPNDISLTTAGITYQIFANKTAIAAGETQEKTEIKARQRSFVQIPLNIHLKNSLQTLTTAYFSGTPTPEIHLKASVTVATGFGPHIVIPANKSLKLESYLPR